MGKLKLAKSKKRITEMGEVFTPKKIVNKMLDFPVIKEQVENLKATFLEPSAGEGAFLVTILERKLKYAAKQSKGMREFGNNALMVLSTLYGIELLEDNVEMLVMNMNETFANNYRELGMEFFEAEPDLKVYRSAKIIIRANMAQGDALKKVDASGNPIIFSEWQPIGKTRVQRTEYTFESIINNDGPIGTVQNQTEQLDLFAINDEPIEAQKFSEQRYAECKWTDVYKELVEYVS